jgi:hypothetical protein
MIIDFEPDVDDPDFDLLFEDFDTDDTSGESEKRTARAFARLVEMYAELENDLDKLRKGLTAVGLSYTFDGDVLISRRENAREAAIAWFAAELTESDDEAARK